MKIKLIEKSITNLWELYRFVLRKLNWKKFIRVYSMILMSSLVVSWLGIYIHGSTLEEASKFMSVFLLPIVIFPIYWGGYYYFSKGKEVEFLEAYIVCGEKKIDYSSVRIISIQKNSNFTISTNAYPFDYKFVGYSDKVFDEVLAFIRRNNEVPVKIIG